MHEPHKLIRFTTGVSERNSTRRPNYKVAALEIYYISQANYFLVWITLVSDVTEPFNLKLKPLKLQPIIMSRRDDVVI